MDLSLLPTTCLPRISVDGLSELLIHHCDNLYGVDSDSEESEGIAAVDSHAWKSCVLPCAPLPGDSLLLMVCKGSVIGPAGS